MWTLIDSMGDGSALMSLAWLVNIMVMIYISGLHHG